MKGIKETIAEYLKKERMVQIATCSGDQPWCCTLFYAYDEDWNIYWISKPDTRHSLELKNNSKVAGAIAYEQDPDNRLVRGLQFEGVAKEVSGEEEEKAAKVYIEMLQRELSLLDDIRSGKNPHKFYKVTPSKFVLFDRVNFPENERQEFVIN